MAEVAQRTNAPTALANRKPNPRRVHNSCDRCRGRKTKCIDPVPGPCRYCARTGSTCRIATPRRKRPYYHVTEEEYQCSLRILEHFFPDQELNLQSLRSIAKDLVAGNGTPTPVQQAQIAPNKEQLSEEAGYSNEIEVVVESVNDLHEPLGCMMKDSRGRYRYIGPHSEIPFNAAVCAMKDDHHKEGVGIITPPKVGSFPPSLPTPASTPTDVTFDAYKLPPRARCDHYVSRFLSEVHCTHWFYSIEALHDRIEQTYSSPKPSTNSSWMCSLYAIFAVGAANAETSSSPSSNGSTSSIATWSSADYIALAKQLIPAVYDEADIDSIRALGLLSIAMENLCSRVTSYLYVGAAIQIAYSLGLHRDGTSSGSSSMDREQGRRIWWTLFMLEQETSSRGGSPSLIDERMLKVDTAFPSEQMLYPGMHTPLSWLSTSVSLSRLKQDIIHGVYPERSSTSRNLSFSTISNLLLSLQKWHQLIPPHLKHNVPAPPTQKRAIAVLHLNYWSSAILLCRPFLLSLVLKGTTFSRNKKTWFERMGKTCIDAAVKSIDILQQMAADGSLSSLTAFDSTCILRAIMIFILAFAHTKMQHYHASIESGLDLLRGMEQVGFCKVVTQETPLRLADLGIGKEDKSCSAAVLLDDNLIAQLWGTFDSNFMTPLQSQTSLDFAFDESSSFELNSDDMPLTAPDDSLSPDPSAMYSSFDFR